MGRYTYGCSECIKRPRFRIEDRCAAPEHDVWLVTIVHGRWNAEVVVGVSGIDAFLQGASEVGVDSYPLRATSGEQDHISRERLRRTLPG